MFGSELSGHRGAQGDTAADEQHHAGHRELPADDPVCGQQGGGLAASSAGQRDLQQIREPQQDGAGTLRQAEGTAGFQFINCFSTLKNYRLSNLDGNKCQN